jgi:2-oxoglutarate/2-oxoacid ferredoxin oxidoreductase subunit beta
VSEPRTDGGAVGGGAASRARATGDQGPAEIQACGLPPDLAIGIGAAAPPGGAGACPAPGELDECAADALEIEQFLHTERLPHIWCPGCGIGIVTGAFLRAVVDLGLVREKTVVVGGIGCSSRAVGYIDLGTVHAIHGRALAFATGIKMARPDFTVVVLTGDGDGAAIGGNHLIHACRRNIDITCILFNNQTYGMTGGQISPTMEPGDRGTTAPYGSIEPPFDLCRLAEAAGASFVARGTAATIRPLERLIKQGIQHHGFSFVEAVVPCPTEYGKRNPPAGVTAMLDETKARSVTVGQAAKMPPEQLAGKIVIGILHENKDAPEFQASYAALVAGAEEMAASAAVPRKRRSVRAPAAEAAQDDGGGEETPSASGLPDVSGLPCEGGE